MKEYTRELRAVANNEIPLRVGANFYSEAADYIEQIEIQNKELRDKVERLEKVVEAGQKVIDSVKKETPLHEDSRDTFSTAICFVKERWLIRLRKALNNL